METLFSPAWLPGGSAVASRYAARRYPTATWRGVGLGVEEAAKYLSTGTPPCPPPLYPFCTPDQLRNTHFSP